MRFFTTILTLLTLTVLRAPIVGAQSVYTVDVTGVIELGLAPYVKRALVEAEAASARAVILEMNTPGGRVDAALQIVAAITESEVPVYTLVHQQAWSAGAMIALATDSVFMRPGSSMGAATPVDGGGTRASEKIVSAMRGEFRALAERRALDPRIAEAMVDETISVEGVIEAGQLLTLTAGEAVRLGFAAAEVEDLDELTRLLAVQEVERIRVELNWAERLVRFLSHPVVAPILLSIGTLGLIVEIKTSTFGLAGIVGLAALGAFFGSHLLIGLAGWEEIILLTVGLVAVAFEILVVPGFGVAGIIGVLSLGSAAFLALLGSLPTWGDVGQAAGVLASAVIMIGVVVYALVRNVPNSRKMRGIFLDAATDKELGYLAAPERLDLIGMVGTALTDLRPSGTARISGERVDVVSEGDYIGEGTRVKIIHSESLRHVVVPVDEDDEIIGG